MSCPVCQRWLVGSFIILWRLSVACALIATSLTSTEEVHHACSAPSSSIARRLLRVASNRNVCVLMPEQEQYIDTAKELSIDLTLPLVSLDALDDGEGSRPAFDHALVVQPYDSWGTGHVITDIIDFALYVQPITPADCKRIRKGGKSADSVFAMKPICIDFCPEKSERQLPRLGKDLLVQAVAPRKGKIAGGGGAAIYDLTAGFGQDSLVLAQDGARTVTMVERDPLVYVLLDDARRRLALVADSCIDESRRELASDLNDKLSFIHGDGVAVASSLVGSAGHPDQLPDVVFIDSMFPPRTKRASVKKNMQVLHSLLQSQEQTDERLVEESALLNAALALAQSRVVCKRPITAPPVGMADDPRPSYNIRGSTSRWDVYLI